MPRLRHGPRRLRPTHPGAPCPLDNEASGLSVQLDLVRQLRLIQENLGDADAPRVADPDDAGLGHHVAAL